MQAPQAPDPVATAQAQSGYNIQTGAAQQAMNMVGQNTPWGNLSYDQVGTQTIIGPNGESIQVPRYNSTVTLSPGQQAIFDQTQQAQSNLAKIASDQSRFLQDYLGQGVDTSGVPDLATSAGQSADIGGGFNTNFGQDIGGGYNAAFNPNIGNGYDAAFNQNIGGAFSDTLGPDYQTGVNLANSYAGADDFSADRQRYEDALWQRGASDRAAQEEALRTRLVNSGLREGSAAWNAEMERLQRQNTDAQLATMLAAGDEQARMVGLARDAAMFGNDATLAQAGFGNNALAQQMQLQNQAALAQGQFGQNAQQLQNQAALAQGQFGSQQQQLQNDAALNAAQFGSQQQQAQNAAALAQGQFGNQANLTNAQFQNAARGQGLSEAYAARSQPLNELAALMSGAQVQQPNFMSTPQTGVGGVDYTGLVNNQYQSQLANHNAMLGGLFGLLSSPFQMFSFG